MISFACPRCSKGYHVADDKAGKRTRCPACGEHLVVPGGKPPWPSARAGRSA
jgi:DNA-directed RNA polymerase subunit RPC12/RpoP